jgi:hypothetical protein
MDLNKKLFDLDYILDNLNYSTIFKIYNDLIILRNEFETTIQEMLLEEDYVESNELTYQLTFLDENIHTLKTAMSLHESTLIFQGSIKEVEFQFSIN